MTGISVFLIVLVVLIIFIVGIRFILYSKLKLSSKRTVNTLSILENDLGRQFRYLELDYMSLNPVLFKKIQDLPENSSTDNINKAVKKLWECEEINKSFNINQKPYKKVIVTPLIMDFNYRNYDRDFKKEIHYFLRPRKMVVDQTLDLFKGIFDYYENSKYKLLEIFPFLGINTQNYFTGKEPDYDGGKLLSDVLNKYFSGFKKTDTAEKRYKNLNNSRKKFIKAGNYANNDSFYFAGIKLYPPLGFDPWPDKTNNYFEYKKVKMLYKYCIEKNIPITVHCSDGGFQVDKRKIALENTSPEKWIQVLKKYKDLKINFAHFGIQEREFRNKWGNWLKIILDILYNNFDDYKNVYVDLSCIGVNDREYWKLAKVISRYAEANNIDKEEFYKKLNKRLLFGTDFMVNLFGVRSYKKYLKIFSETKAFSNKENFSTTNPEKFLFG